ncbi:hypothetical protein SCHPADRAFT_947032 [Schizopora paradoxa]|uniref:Uncharacterized protein n=1 Tax=Schizopora paradoxa TaxID=27342 RepID=A0A0H2R744_9AGAM|nr:hypothetical protein SCHPADRAFT_947032 [Schizopora paradoxa]
MGNIITSMLNPDEARAIEDLYRSLGFVRFCALIRTLAGYLDRVARGLFSLSTSSSSVGGILCDDSIPHFFSQNILSASESESPLIRTHTEAFLDDINTPTSNKKRAISPAEEIGSIFSDKLRVGNIEDLIEVDCEPSGDGTCVESYIPPVQPLSFFDLPYDILHLIGKVFQTRPASEWPPLMYSNKLWHNMLSGPLLRSVGFLHSPEPGLTTVRSTLEVSGFDAFKALSHWRLSQYFANVKVVKFKLSKEDWIRNVQLSHVATFFATLPAGEPHFCVVQIHLTDYDCGVELSALSQVLKLLYRTGCDEFWINSSYLCEPGRVDSTPAEAAIEPGREEHYFHGLDRLSVYSPTVFSPTLMPWFVQTLASGHSLSHLDVSSVGMTASGWAGILPHVTLRCLRNLRLVGVDLGILYAFLLRHPWLRSISLDGLSVTEGNPPPVGVLALPDLYNIEGTEVQIAHFLHLLRPSNALPFVNLDFRDDSSSETLGTAIDGDACLLALHRLADLLLPEDAYLMLHFDFSKPRTFIDKSFLTILNTSDPLSRPENLLSVNRLEINIFGQSQAESIELLEKCLSWTTQFASIKFLKFFVGEEVLTRELRKSYVEAFSNVLPETTISLSF